MRVPSFEDGVLTVAEWCGGVCLVKRDNTFVISINTLEDTMTADPGDYVIKGVEGEFYPCKPSIFEASYELTLDGK